MEWIGAPDFALLEADKRAPVKIPAKDGPANCCEINSTAVIITLEVESV